MPNISTAQKENTTLDVCKAIASILVVYIHMPSIFASPVHDQYFQQWFPLFCVPFFFVCTGYFFYKSQNKGRSIRRILSLLALSYTIYFPAVFQNVTDLHSFFSTLRWTLVFGYGHLWYLNATLEGMLIWYTLKKIPVSSRWLRKLAVPASFCLLMIGALLDEHYPLLNIPAITAAGDFLSVFGGPRNVIFMGLPLMVLGGAAAKYASSLRKIPVWSLIAGWILLRVLSFLECTYLFRSRGPGISTDLTFFGCLPALVLLLFALRVQIPIPEHSGKLLRRMAEYVYILHPMVSEMLLQYLCPKPLFLWLGSVVISALIYYLLEKQFNFKRN